MPILPALIYLNKSFKTKAGFTLIEIMVAATIIGLLSSIGFAGFQAVTRSGRDALRRTDLEQIRSALEIYKSEYSTYPDDADSDCRADLPAEYINPYPSDPKDQLYNYCYIFVSSLQYQLCAHLENGDTVADNCSSSGTNNCGQNCNYMVVNP